MKIGSIWQEALHYISREPASDGWVVLSDPKAKGLTYLSIKLRKKEKGKEVERLVKIGASRYPWKYEPGADFVVLEDPDGNLFCVVQKAIE